MNTESFTARFRREHPRLMAKADGRRARDLLLFRWPGVFGVKAEYRRRRTARQRRRR